MFLKGYGFCSFARNMGKNINENLSSKYNQKPLDHAKKSDSCKTASKRTIQKPAEATGDLIGTKITDKIAKFSKKSPQNNSERNEEIYREKYIS